MSDSTATFATPRITADRILLVGQADGNGWDISGGYAEAGGPVLPPSSGS